MKQPVTERRQFQRLPLEQPIVGRFMTANVLVLNVSVTGALVEHHGEIKVGTAGRLAFRWGDHEIIVGAVVVRSMITRFVGSPEDTRPRPIYNCGVHFENAIGESDRWLREMIAYYVTRALDIQKANARGVPYQEPTFGDSTLSRLARRGDSTQGFISCRRDSAGWQKIPTANRKQPFDGFTVSASEADVDLLCQTYEEADEEGRRLIRILAGLSVSEACNVPPRLYEP